MLGVEILRNCCFIVLIFGHVSETHGQFSAENLTDVDVTQAISMLIDESVQKWDPDHHWDPKKPRYDHSPHGQTPLTVLGLLHAGVKFQDPRLQPSVQWMMKTKLTSTYAISCRAQALGLMPESVLPLLRQDTKWLLHSFGEEVGCWGYRHNPKTKRIDNSLRQYGALALWEGAKRGAQVPRSLWTQLERNLLLEQRADGGWGYSLNDAPRSSMTLAAITMLAIAQDWIHSEEAVKGQGVSLEHNQAALQRGLTWVDKYFDPTINASVGEEGITDHGWWWYHAYCVERVALATGRHRFGKHDWFRTIAARMLNLKFRREKGKLIRNGYPFSTVDRAFALMFLSRGRVPVAINKLVLNPKTTNRRPRDAANWAEYLTRLTEEELNWQIVTLEDSLTQWTQSTLLFLTGKGKILPTGVFSHESSRSRGQSQIAWKQRCSKGEFSNTRAMEQAKDQLTCPPQNQLTERIQEYLEHGGLVVAAADQNDRAFSTSIRELGLTLYPEAHWKNLSKDHWIYQLHEPVRGRVPVVESLQAGGRDRILLFPTADVGAILQQRDIRRTDIYRTLANIYFCASGFQKPTVRLHGNVISNKKEKASDTEPVLIIEAIHSGDWNPEPKATEKIASWIDESLDVTVNQMPLANIASLEQPAFVWVRGTSTSILDSEEIQALEHFSVHGDGVLLFEDVHGTGMFCASIEAQISNALGQDVVPAYECKALTEPSFNHIPPVSNVTYQRRTTLRLGSRDRNHRLRTIKIPSKKAQMYFSREDLSHALLNRPWFNTNGYSTESARAILRSLIHASKMKPDTSPSTSEW